MCRQDVGYWLASGHDLQVPSASNLQQIHTNDANKLQPVKEISNGGSKEDYDLCEKFGKYHTQIVNIQYQT